MRSFLSALDDRILVCDGAMGTMLYERGVFLNRSFDQLNLTEPDLVAEVHQLYVRAGADVLETNTFGANRCRLATFGLEGRLHAINVQGARIARHAARDDVWVAGAMGPLGVRVEPWGRTGLEEAEAHFREQVAALLEGGVDLFVLETFIDVTELGAAVRAIRGLSDRPVVAQITTGEDSLTLDGVPPEVFTRDLVASGADVIGVNCSTGPAPMLETIERMAAVAPDARLSAQPNAGRPRDVDGRAIYLSSPGYLASYARRFIRNGVRLVGGCCGTTPAHIRDIVQAVRSARPGPVRSSRASVVPDGAGPEAASFTPVARPDKSRLASALEGPAEITLVAVRPPRGLDSAGLVEQVRMLAARGITVTVRDGGPDTGRIPALTFALLLERDTTVETVLQYACREHDLPGMQADLLGAHALGLRNLLLVTGELAGLDGRRESAGPVDVDSIGLTNVVARLNQGRDIGGKSLGGPAAFHIGVAANPSAEAMPAELQRFRYKVEAGAEYVVTRAIYDIDRLDRFLDATADVHLPVIGTVRPFVSLRHAEFVANELPGVVVPPSLIERMRTAEVAGRAPAEGLEIARELITALRMRVRGVQVVAPQDDPRDILPLLAPL